MNININTHTHIKYRHVEIITMFVDTVTVSQTMNYVLMFQFRNKKDYHFIKLNHQIIRSVHVLIHSAINTPSTSE